jgi:hypothetical protein
MLDLQGHLTEGASKARLRAAILDLAEARTVISDNSYYR